MEFFNGKYKEKIIVIKKSLSINRFIYFISHLLMLKTVQSFFQDILLKILFRCIQIAVFYS